MSASNTQGRTKFKSQKAANQELQKRMRELDQKEGTQVGDATVDYIDELRILGRADLLQHMKSGKGRGFHLEVDTAIEVLRATLRQSVSDPEAQGEDFDEFNSEQALIAAINAELKKQDGEGERQISHYMDVVALEGPKESEAVLYREDGKLFADIEELARKILSQSSRTVIEPAPKNITPINPPTPLEGVLEKVLGENTDSSDVLSEGELRTILETLDDNDFVTDLALADTDGDINIDALTVHQLKAEYEKYLKTPRTQDEPASSGSIILGESQTGGRIATQQEIREERMQQIQKEIRDIERGELSNQRVALKKAKEDWREANSDFLTWREARTGGPHESVRQSNITRAKKKKKEAKEKP
jgi:hypothetical protein